MTNELWAETLSAHPDMCVMVQPLPGFSFIEFALPIVSILWILVFEQYFILNLKKEEGL